MTQDVCTDFAVEDCATRHNYKALGMQTRRHALVDTERRSDFEQVCRAAVRVCVCARVRVCAGAHADAVPSGASAKSGAGAATGRSRAEPMSCNSGVLLWGGPGRSFEDPTPSAVWNRRTKCRLAEPAEPVRFAFSSRSQCYCNLFGSRPMQAVS